MTGILRDVVALHYIRSQHYREVFDHIFNEFVPRQRHWLLTERADQLEAAYLQRTGPPPTGPQELAALADEIFSLMIEQYHDGSLLRVRIEDSFNRARELMAQNVLTILQPEEGEFLIGDNPALAVREEGDNLFYGMALMAMPLLYAVAGWGRWMRTARVPVWVGWGQVWCSARLSR
ncbi:hypothetical protein [Streptomyces mirabilis]|uniref:hypothetical protein n=1 Tax=Streptomyces mirabilis TaxID=68239 RepID=UPI002F91B4E8